MQFARRLALAIEVSGWSQRQLAEKLGTHHSVVNAWCDEADDSTPSAEVLELLPPAIERALYAMRLAALAPAATPGVSALELAAQVNREAGEFIGAVLERADARRSLKELCDVEERLAAAKARLLADLAAEDAK